MQHLAGDFSAETIRHQFGDNLPCRSKWTPPGLLRSHGVTRTSGPTYRQMVDVPPRPARGGRLEWTRGMRLGVGGRGDGEMREGGGGGGGGEVVQAQLTDLGPGGRVRVRAWPMEPAAQWAGLDSVVIGGYLHLQVWGAVL